MRKRSIEVAVGFFVVLSIAALMMLALRVSGLNQYYSGDKGFTLKADFENIGGLKLRSRVSLAGVPVGRVTDIAFDNEKYVATVTMLLKNNTKIPSDSEFSILTAGFLGDNYVGIKAGLADEFLLNDNHVDMVLTHKAVVLEELISKFLANSGSSSKSDDQNKNNSDTHKKN